MVQWGGEGRKRLQGPLITMQKVKWTGKKSKNSNGRTQPDIYQLEKKKWLQRSSADFHIGVRLGVLMTEVFPNRFLCMLTLVEKGSFDGKWLGENPLYRLLEHFTNFTWAWRFMC